MNDQKKKQSWVRFLPYLFLTALIANGVLIMMHVAPALSDSNATEANVQEVKVKRSIKIGEREFVNADISNDEYRKLAKQLDQKVLDAYKRRKASKRQTYTDVIDPVGKFEKKIDRLERELQDNFSKEDIAEEGSVAYGLAKDIERMKKDAPDGYIE